METYLLRITLKSDATFGRGDGVPGLVDAEIEHDVYGLPYLRGKTLKGLLVEECTNILYALHTQPTTVETEFYESAARLFGQPGSRADEPTALRVGDARLPEALHRVIQTEVEQGRLKPAEVLEALTDIRYQTAVDETGKPETGSLRATRVILRETVFEAELSLAPLDSNTPISDRDRGLLAACVKALRRAGVNRNRGAGRLSATLWQNGADRTGSLFAHFTQEVVKP
jgi:CRISPR/Cas system CSM-associated protein Csm3 (group 7 of RAMP superfamily)